jgi:hypothetical protein
MQTLPVYLYPNTLDVILDLDPTTRGAYRVMYQRDLKIQKGIKNKIRIQFKNSDQKRITIDPDSIYVFSMFDPNNQMLLIEKQLVVLDDGTFANRGIAELTLTESDTMDLPIDDYQFAIKYMDPSDGTYLPAYSNTYYGMAGFLTVAQDVYPMLQPSQEITAFQQTYDDSIQAYRWISGNIYAYPEYNENTALHTAAVYMTNFSGTVLVQGTLYNSPDYYNRYVTISSQNYTNFSGIDYFNFNGIFSYVRFQFIPATAPGESNNNNPEFYGSLDQILYRC